MWRQQILFLSITCAAEAQHLQLEPWAPTHFCLDICVKSIYLRDTRRCGVQDHIVEGEQGWVLQGVLSRASFRRAAVSGQKFFTVLSLHICNIFGKKKGIAKKIIQTLRATLITQDVELVAGDFNGIA